MMGEMDFKRKIEDLEGNQAAMLLDIQYSFKKLKEIVVNNEREIKYLKSQLDNLRRVVDSAEVVIDGTTF